MTHVVKGQLGLSTAARRTQIIDAVTAAAGPLDHEGFCVASADMGANGLRLKLRFLTQQDAQAVYDASLAAAVTRAPRAGSYLRFRDEQRALLAEQEW